MARIKRLSIKQLLKKNYSNSKALQNLAYGAAKKKLDKLKRETISELDKHPVTKEIEKGPSGMGSPLLGGTGNFFGFLGFDKGSRPVEILRSALQDHIQLKRQKAKLKKVSDTLFTWEFDISVPSKTEIYAVTPFAWSGRSWVKGVERGITNYTHTGFRESEDSRSGIAFQSKQKIRFVSFTPTPYISALLEKLKKEFK